MFTPTTLQRIANRVQVSRISASGETPSWLPMRTSTYRFWASQRDFSASEAYGSEPDWVELAHLSESVCGRRPKPLIEIDQCPVDAHSLVRRVKRMWQLGDIVGSAVLLGDNDSMCIALRAVAPTLNMLVFDIDSRVLSFVNHELTRLGKQNVATQQIDFRDRDGVARLLEHYRHQFELATMDPPYTTAAYTVYLSIAADMLCMGGVLYVVVPFMLSEEWTLDLMAHVQRSLFRNGFVVTDCLRSEQTFRVGAGVVSSLLRAEKRAIAPVGDDEGQFFSGSPFYTLG